MLALNLKQLYPSVWIGTLDLTRNNLTFVLRFSRDTGCQRRRRVKDVGEEKRIDVQRQIRIPDGSGKCVDMCSDIGLEPLDSSSPMSRRLSWNRWYHCQV